MFQGTFQKTKCAFFIKIIKNFTSIFALEKNYAGCKSNAISVGAYWYSYALTPEQAKKEAATCIKAIENKTFEYPIYFDIENKTQLALSEDLLQRITIAFCDELESAGY